MSIPVSNPVSEEAQAPITDMEFVVMCSTFQVPYTYKIKRNGKTVFYYDKSTPFRDLLDRWQKGIPMPVDDIKKVFAALRSFYSAVHDDV